ncbi:efflux RND transporter periplasmic adaptor subunit [Planctomicrobium sp. SH661]|uniref:efflux RND transporter periplasmic adaptor subunit n=1 Tax=Planctomicrobium sp. SH661 TaxID=3448124 RepID=UPI003F5BA72D
MSTHPVQTPPFKMHQPAAIPAEPVAPGHHPAGPPAGEPRKTSLFQKLMTLIGLAVGGVLIWAYAAGWLGKDHREPLPPENLSSSEVPQGIVVTAEPISIRPIKRTIEAVGTLFGFEEIVVSSKVEGRVLKIEHDVSDRIAPGELLVEVDPTDLRLAVEQAESNLRVEMARLGLNEVTDEQFELIKVPTVLLASEKRELARLKMERVQSLAERQATTQEGVDNAVSEFRMAGAEYENQLLMAKSGLATIKARQAALAIAQQQLAETRVRAPVPQRAAPPHVHEKPYVMTRRSIAEGTFVRVGDEICRLVIDGTLKLKLAVPERYSAEIQNGQNVQVFTSSSTTPYEGIVTMINPAVETQTRTFQVEVQVANDRPGLKPGGFAKAVIEVGNDPEARTIPLAAMVRYAGVVKLFVVDQSIAREVQFTPGVQTSEWVEVAKPTLDPGALVVTSGQFSLANGTKIQVRKQLHPESEQPAESPPDPTSQGESSTHEAK